MYLIRFGRDSEHKVHTESFASALICARTLRTFWRQNGSILGYEVTLVNADREDESEDKGYRDGLTDEEREMWEEP